MFKTCLAVAVLALLGSGASAGRVLASTSEAATSADAVANLPHLQGPEYPPSPAKGGDQAAVSRAEGARQSCYRLSYDHYCAWGYQQNCCQYETRTTYGGCSVSDGNYNCGRYAPIMVCCR